eukprot:8090248-Karenia_brevis.AAC.2
MINFGAAISAATLLGRDCRCGKFPCRIPVLSSGERSRVVPQPATRSRAFDVSSAHVDVPSEFSGAT